MIKYLLCILVFIGGCATPTKSTLLGTGIGMVSGALLGSAVGQNGSHEEHNQATFVGAAVGAGLGSLIGYHAHKKEDTKKLGPNPFKGTQNGNESDLPPVLMPTVKKVWVEDKIENNGATYVKGHWIYILDAPVQWSK